MAVAGTWNITVSTPLGAQKGTLDVTVDGSTLAGTAQILGGSTPLTDGSVDGNEMRFVITVTNPMKIDLNFHLLVDGDTLTGTAKAGPIGEQKVVGERA
ncbi:MAG: hypothetical protein ACRCZD_13585 [Phycicoccus sp.]